jgi:hypothetical protein
MSEQQSSADSAQPEVWMWRATVGGVWGSWRLLDQPIDEFKKSAWGFNLGNGTAEVRALYARPERTEPQASAVSAQPDQIEDIAKWLHEETNHPDSYPDHTWPETDRDDGQREGGFVKIVPKHSQAYFRDIARRLVARYTFAEPQTAWRPIETAPKDVPVDLWYGGHRYADCHWADQIYAGDEAWGWHNQMMGRIRSPSHWMPVPASPTNHCQAVSAPQSPLLEAVEKIAKQALSTETDGVTGDYEYGYDECIRVARAALSRPLRADEPAISSHQRSQGE